MAAQQTLTLYVGVRISHPQPVKRAGKSSVHADFRLLIFSHSKPPPKLCGSFSGAFCRQSVVRVANRRGGAPCRTHSTQPRRGIDTPQTPSCAFKPDCIQMARSTIHPAPRASQRQMNRRRESDKREVHTCTPRSTLAAAECQGRQILHRALFAPRPPSDAQRRLFRAIYPREKQKDCRLCDSPFRLRYEN